MEELVAKIIFDISNAQANLKELSKGLGEVDAGTKKVGNSAKEAAGGFKEFLKAEIIFEGLKKAYDLLNESIREGIHEMEQTDAVFTRASAAAHQAGISFGEMVSMAQKLESPIFQATTALDQLSQLTARGFSLKDADNLVRQIQDISATVKPAGVSVSDFSKTVVNAFTRMKFNSVDLQRAFPGLKQAMDGLGHGATDLQKKTVLLEAVQKQYNTSIGGSAKYLNTYQGAMEALQVAVSDVKEGLATGFTPALTMAVQILKNAIPAGTDLKAVAMELGHVLGEVLVAAVYAVVAALKAMVVAWDLVKLSLSGAKQAALEFEAYITKMAAGALQDIKKLADGFVDAGLKMVNAAKSLSVLTPGVDTGIFDKAIDGLDKLKSKVDDFADSGTKNMEKFSDAFNNLSEKNAEDFSKQMDNLVKDENAATKANDDLAKSLGGTALSYNRLGTAAGDATPPVHELTEEEKKQIQALKDLADAQEHANASAEIAKQKQNIQDLLHVQNELLDMAKSGTTTWEEAVAELKKYGDGMTANSKQYQDEYNQLKARLQLMEQNADGTNENAAAIAALTEKQKLEKEAQEAYIQYCAGQQAASEKLIQTISTLAGMFSQLGQSMGGLTGGVLGSVGGGLGSLAQGFSQIGGPANAFGVKMTKSLAIIGAVATGMDMLGQAIGGKAGGVISSIGQFAATGAMFGPWGAAVGAAVGAVIGLLKAFAHDFMKDTEDVIKQFGIVGDLSDDLMKKMADDAKKIGDAGSSAVMHLGDMMQELGVSETTLPGFFNTLMYGFDAVDKGFISAADQAKVLADTFPQLADAAIQFGGAAMDQLKDVIAKIAETGIGLDTLKTYFEQLKATVDQIKAQVLSDLITQVNGLGDAFSKLMDKMKAKGTAAGGGDKNWQDFLSDKDLNQIQHRFQSLQRYAVDTFRAMQASGASTYEIFQQLGPLFDKLDEAASKFGLHGSAAFRQFSEIMDEMKAHASQFANLDFMAKITQRLAELNAATQRDMNALMGNIFHMFTQLTGLTIEQINAMNAAFDKGTGEHTAKTRQSLQAMLPYLIQVLGLHNQMGLAISAQDRALIELAKHYGLLPKDTSQVGLDPTITALQRMSDILVLIAKLLGATADQLKHVGDAAKNTSNELVKGGNDAANAWNRDVKFNIDITTTGDVPDLNYTKDDNGGGKKDPSKGGGDTKKDLAYEMTVPYDGFQVTLHKGEKIIPSPANDRTGTNNPRNAKLTTGNVTYVTHNHFHSMSDDQISKVIQKQKKENTK